MTETRITDPVTGGQKGQKQERYDLLPFDALDEVARVYGVGASKYADDNWLRGYRWRLSAGALLRHVAQWMMGRNIDDGPGGTGCHHLACAAWHCLTLLTFTMRGLGTDDRAVPQVDEPIPYVPVATGLKFRFGDVVQIKGYEEGIIAGRGSEFWIVESPSHGEGYWLEDSLILLRRPVRVGDELVHSDGKHRAVAKIPASLSGWGRAGWTHADGTAIEPPPAREPASGAV